MFNQLRGNLQWVELTLSTLKCLSYTVASPVPQGYIRSPATECLRLIHMVVSPTCTIFSIYTYLR